MSEEDKLSKQYEKQLSPELKVPNRVYDSESLPVEKKGRGRPKGSTKKGGVKFTDV